MINDYTIFADRCLEDCLQSATVAGCDPERVTRAVNNGHALANSDITILFNDTGIAEYHVLSRNNQRLDIDEQVGYHVTSDQYNDLAGRVNMVLSLMQGEPLCQETIARIHQGVREVSYGWLEDLEIVEIIPELSVAVAILNTEGALDNAIIIKN